MNNTDTKTIPRRVVYVEDAKTWRTIYGGILEKGLQSQNMPVKVEPQEDFSLIQLEIKNNARLADCYILDNDISRTPSVIGALVAQDIYQAAQDRGQEVLVITLLASDPDGVKLLYGDGLEKKGIPALSKLSEAHLCFFYIGNILEEGLKIGFDEWMKREGLLLPNDTGAVRTGILGAMTEGGLFMKPLAFAQMHENSITRFMDKGTVREFVRTFPFKPPGMEGVARTGSPTRK